MGSKPLTTPRGQRQASPPPMWIPIITEIAKTHRLHPKDMMSGWKSDECVAARQELWFVLKNRGISLTEIGRRTGGYHHTTVAHGVGKWEERANG